jgi:hypothetical protein
MRKTLFLIFIITLVLCCQSCSKKPDTGQDAKVTTLGSIEVTAELVEIKGKLIDDPLYDYSHVMKYKVLQVQRGELEKDIIYVGHYNPAKTRAAAADVRAPEIGGNLTRFRQGDIHRMAMEVPIDDYFMGGIINKYFGEVKDPVHWPVWTNLVVK